MLNGKRDIIERLDRLEQRLAGLETAVQSLGQEAALRATIDEQRKQIESLGEQGMHVIGLLDDARKELRQLRGE